jgi:hypothetical protein
MIPPLPTGRTSVLILAGLVISLGRPVSANERPPVPPNTTPVPVVRTLADAETALETARRSGTALVADLTRGQTGVIVQAVPATALAPGRYRLHALAATTPHAHILVEAVALRLTAGPSTDTFDRVRSFQQPGTLAPVYLDFLVKETGAVAIRAEWLVGDSMLDRQKHKQLEEARRAYRGLRQQALDQLLLADPEHADELVPDPAEERPLAPRALADADLPPYRLQLSGLVIERLSPVAVLSVTTNRPAYEPAALGRVSTTLRNWSPEPVQVPVTWTVEDDARPGTIVARHTETVALAAGEQRDLVLTAPLQTAGIARLGRVRVEAAVAGARADACRTPFVILPPAPAHTPERSKKVFAHYMGCFPAGTGVTRYHRLAAGDAMHHDRGDEVSRFGGGIRNWPLVPLDPALTPEESADLEIRRAMRIGINGFAVDAWAGGDGAKQVFDTLLKVAAAKNYPFELTICLDPACGGRLVETVREALDRWGANPKFARRDGKPLIFTYFSYGLGLGALYAELDERIPDVERDTAVTRMRATELGWHLMGQSFRKAQEALGQPIYYTFDLVYFFHQVPKELITPELPPRAAAAIARHVPALTSFGFYGFNGKHAEVAKAVRDAGAEWGWAGGMHQKESFFEVFTPKATDWLRFIWADTIDDQATLVQLITWNDYNENTHLAPAYNTRYTIYDLTGYFIEQWRTGKPPAVDHDRVYLTYAKYPKDANSWPFKIRDRRDRALEVLTILPSPATVRLPGRGIEYEAPAGLHVQQFPVPPGPVIAEVVRGGKVAVRLDSPEPITDRPFRQDVGLVCWSTEEQRHWQADFGDKPTEWYSEYGDLDGDGLPNWFEMYWFGKWLDFSTATKADPTADPDEDGKSNLDEYREQTHPKEAPAPTAPADPD